MSIQRGRHSGSLNSIIGKNGRGGRIIILLSLAVVIFLITIVGARQTAAQEYDCIYCHGANYHGDNWQGCSGCHDSPPQTGSHLVHYNSAPLLAIKYGDVTVSSTADAYKFGCGNCHPLDHTKHNTGQLDVELYNPAAPAGSIKSMNPSTASYTPGSTVSTYASKMSGGQPFSWTDGTCSNVYCHSNGTYLSTGSIPAGNSTPSWGSTSAQLACSACHGFPPSYQSGQPKANSHMARSHRQTCNFCHVATTADGSTITTFSSHVNGALDVYSDASAMFYTVPVSFSYSYASGGGTCSSISCHNGTSGTWGGTFATENCVICHANIIQSGTGQNHHASACTTCHGTASWPLHEGATPPACLSCHPAEAALKYAMPGATCESCHIQSGVIPVTSGTGSVCRSCHPTGSYDPYATNMHLQNPTAAFGVGKSGLTVNVDGSASSCPSGATCSYDFDWGDGTTHGASIMDSHTYGAGGTYTITLTVSSNMSPSADSVSHDVTLSQANRPPIAAMASGSPSANGWTVSVTDASTDPDGNLGTSSTAITVTWGNSSSSRCAPGGTVSKTYTVAGTYVISLSATDTLGLTSETSPTASVTIAMGTVSGTVKDGNGAGVNLVKVMIGTKYAYTNSSGNYSISNVKPGTGYTMTAVKGTTTYATQTWVTSGVPGTVLPGANTVNFTP